MNVSLHPSGARYDATRLPSAGAGGEVTVVKL